MTCSRAHVLLNTGHIKTTSSWLDLIKNKSIKLIALVESNCPQVQKFCTNCQKFVQDTHFRTNARYFRASIQVKIALAVESHL
jgi:hypothetical protein